jgi:hypothetical protein
MCVKGIVVISLLSILPLFGFAQSDAYVLQRILQRYTESYGGFRDADALSSLSVEGTIEQDGQTFSFLMRKKRPYSMRYRLSSGMNKVVTGYNGSVGWLRFEVDGEVVIEVLDASAEAALREQARFDSPLFRHLEKSENDLKLIERATLEDHNVYVIEVQGLGEYVERYYLDAATAHVLRHDQLSRTGKLLLETRYRDYREVDGFPFAYEVETRLDGQTMSLAKINSINVNPGLLSFYFEKPHN